MGSSFIDFKEYGFWGWDGAIEGWLYFLVQEIDKLESIPDWLREARDHWSAQATVGFVGWIHPQLDDYLVSDERVSLVVMLSESVLKWLEEKKEIPQAYLNSLNLPHAGAWGTAGDVEAEMFGRIGRKFIELLQGQLKTDASTSPVF
ncbi:MAG: hypothetical protein LC776_15940 [Acidobacteria bacterium]|nr:hypothetical protein [Acidobacteriota bacterium]